MKDDSGFYGSIHRARFVCITNDGATVINVIARPPRCAGQAADAVYAYFQVKMEDATID